VLDLLAYELKMNRVWIPMARDVGSVDVFDVATASFKPVGGLAVIEKEPRGKRCRSGRAPR
jgi:hypothetical protein